MTFNSMNNSMKKCRNAKLMKKHFGKPLPKTCTDKPIKDK